MITGRLLGIGVGPGDPELLTLKALRYLQAAPVVAYVAAQGQPSIARQIAAPHLPPGQREINIALPMHPSPELADAAYAEGASRIGAELERGRDVAVLCEGDPLLYGSFRQLLRRLGRCSRAWRSSTWRASISRNCRSWHAHATCSTGTSCAIAAWRSSSARPSTRR
jgi:precorrin-2/cobalt-factor-2 C20-methyltransferase